jgi:hypothetical protein
MTAKLACITKSPVSDVLQAFRILVLMSNEKNGSVTRVYWEKLSAYVAEQLWASQNPRWIVRAL